ncbi:MAG: hypothetical protein P4L53_24465 [Candidatus Obscuribacterales bacterium]|nr:hypothetical protein [Candidatus Obscuribacterales bacterium]
MADLSNKDTKLQHPNELRVEDHEPVREMIKCPKENASETESNAFQPLERQPVQIITSSQIDGYKARTILVAAIVVGLTGIALADVTMHSFSAATIRTWISAFAVVGAVISLGRALKKAFKRASDGTIHLAGEQPDKASRPSLRTYLIMFAIFLIFIVILGYASLNSM